MLDELFAEAEALATEQDDLTRRKHDNRDALRVFERNGKLDDEQVAKLHELYPPRKKKG